LVGNRDIWKNFTRFQSEVANFEKATLTWIVNF